MSQDFIADSWQPVLRANALDSFAALWHREMGWFEEPNRRRGGWSGVSRLDLDLPDGGRAALFVKRQQEHTKRTLRHPLRGVLTFTCEFDNLQRMRSWRIPTPEPVYYAERLIEGRRCAVLATVALDGFCSLEHCLQDWQRQGWPVADRKRAIMMRLAAIVRTMHIHYLQHNCLFPKHIFLRSGQGDPDIRIIDLEKAKQRWRVRQAMYRDLDTLSRHALGVRRTDRLRFLLAYLEKDRVDREVRSIWRRLGVLQDKKQRHRGATV